ncbi:FG-GAP-like repeat-containing protein [Fulvivirgaceae bacterium BMA10]|uniref:FG-GAP-like repeat-containing protein n=1 Tax=Splendidivirga corallicola TaxID=3051826 RepID=A0ABT8KH75_9BACT|nr:FG-GAP-like repeat-containing protein [Fulvivirgaceae bacterium BMA10]
MKEYFNKPFALYLFLIPLIVLESYAQNLEEVSQEIGLIYEDRTQVGGGVAFFDYDNDGFDDLYITGGVARDRLYHNNGNGSFEEVGLEAGLIKTQNHVTFGVATGDLNNDGLRDIIVTTSGTSPNLLFQNKGDGTFVEIGKITGLTEIAKSFSASLGDVNQDGFLDIYIANHLRYPNYLYDDDFNVIGFNHECYENFFYINDGTGKFVNQAIDFGVNNNGCSFVSLFTDYDGDNDLDLYVVNDFGEWIKPNAFYINNGPDEPCTDVADLSGTEAKIYGMGVASGDYDEDGDLDLYLTNMGRNLLLNNQGNGMYSDVTELAGVENTYAKDNLPATGWGTGFFDFDNDTYLDLFVANGGFYIPDNHPMQNSLRDSDKLYRNRRDGTFEDISVLEHVADSSRGNGFAYSDFDNDGDLDFIVTVLNTDPDSEDHILFYKNNASDQGGNWLNVKLEGVRNNLDGFGSKVRAYVDGRTFIREVSGGGASFLSQHSSKIHFGLGEYNRIDSLEIIWLGGKRQVFYDISTNQNLTIAEEQIITSISPEDKPASYLNGYGGNDRTLFIEYNLPGTSFAEVELYDLSGKVIFKSFERLEKGSGRKTIRPRTIHSGLHLLKISTYNEVKVFKTLIR